MGFERIQLKMLIYKAAMLLALTGLSRAQEICYLDIRYLIKPSFGYTFHFYKLTKATRKDNLRPPIKYLNFSFSQKFMCLLPH